MAFRADAFAGASLVMPSRQVSVPDLAAWFDGDPVWTVRGLNANELARTEQAGQRLGALAALAAAIEDGTAGEITAGVRALLGGSAEIEPIYARQVEMLVLASVEPSISHVHAARLGESYPVVFRTLVNTVLELTGQGAESPKKPPASTETPA